MIGPTEAGASSSPATRRPSGVYVGHPRRGPISLATWEAKTGVYDRKFLIDQEPRVLAHIQRHIRHLADISIGRYAGVF